MMMELNADLDAFHARLVGVYEALPKGLPLENLQNTAWKHYCKLGLPTRKNDVFRYIKLGQLYTQSYVDGKILNIDRQTIESYIYPECQDSVLVFVNGHYTPELSRTGALDKKMVVLRLNEAMRTYGSLLVNQIGKAIKEEADPFAALNMALHGEGLFVYLPPKTVCETPIQILNVVGNNEQGQMISPRLQIFAGQSSQVEFFSTHALLGPSSGCINQRCDVAVEENARVKFTQVNFHESDDLWHFDALRGTLKRDAALEVIGLTKGSKNVRNDYRIVLAGEQGEALLNGVWMLEGRKEAHQHVFIDHQAPNCVSRQLFKGVLKDSSHSSFEGKIMVRKEAQETNAFQLNRNLLLNEGAMAESKPNLEIFADNVKASHGATIGQLEKEELFYMRSRGFSDMDAKNLLVHGYCQEVIDLIRHLGIKKRIHDMFYGKL